MSTRKRRWTVGIVSLFAAVFVMGQLDFQRIVNEQKPIFARWEAHPADGGSAEFRFPGYTVIYMREIQGMTPDGKQYRVGPKLDYWIPLFGRDGTSLMVRTNR